MKFNYTSAETIKMINLLFNLEELSPSIQAKLLGNVWCGACSKAVYIIVESGIIKKNNLILTGRCADCGGRVTRLIEGD